MKKFTLAFNRNNKIFEVNCKANQIVGVIQDYLIDSYILIWIKEVK